MKAVGGFMRADPDSGRGHRLKMEAAKARIAGDALFSPLAGMGSDLLLKAFTHPGCRRDRPLRPRAGNR